mgnify:CR=1 FL=1
MRNETVGIAGPDARRHCASLGYGLCAGVLPARECYLHLQPAPVLPEHGRGQPPGLQPVRCSGDGLHDMAGIPVHARKTHTVRPSVQASECPTLLVCGAGEWVGGYVTCCGLPLGYADVGDTGTSVGIINNRCCNVGCPSKATSLHPNCFCSCYGQDD